MGCCRVAGSAGFKPEDGTGRNLYDAMVSYPGRSSSTVSGSRLPRSADRPTVLIRPPRYQGRRPLRDPANPRNEGWRKLVTGASLVTVALVPGAAMAVAAVSAAASAVCGFGSFCLYSGPDFTGQKVQYDAGQLFCQDARPGLDVSTVLPGGARSVYNNTSTMSDGLGVKIYSQLGRVVLPTVPAGREVRAVDDKTAKDMHILCAYPR